MTYGYIEGAGDRAGEADWVSPPAAVADPAAAPQNRYPVLPSLPACPELDCIRYLLPPGMIAAAELRAAEVGVGADRVLIAGDIISEEAYLAALANAEGFEFDPLENIPRVAVPLSDEQLTNAAAVGILPVRSAGTLHFIVAPRSRATRALVELARNGSDHASRFSFTTSERMQSFITRLAAQEIAYRATNALRAARPDLSAADSKPRSIIPAILLVTLAFILIGAPSSMVAAFNLALATIFLAWCGLRILSPLIASAVTHRPINFADNELPVYTIIVALYRESAAVKNLIAALRRLDYPKEKLDIKLVLEPDDRETRARLETMRLAAPFELIIAPPDAPRTKPKALNAALPFARGAFVAVYDAEDRPEPDQLRRAIEAFAAGSDRLACVQARLTIDNTADNWLTRLFTAEYAGLFDVFLPSFAAWHLPLPLGGSSNHFRGIIPNP